MTFDVVMAADLDWGIGKDGGLPWPKLRGDMRHFRKTTSDAPAGERNAYVMGRKTWESKEVLGKPLPNRLNIVVSRGDLIVPPDVIAVHSLDEALAVGGVAATFVGGGAGLLAEALDHRALRYIYLTRVEGRFDCDVRIPDLDARGFVRTAWDGEQEATEHGVHYVIQRLQRP